MFPRDMVCLRNISVDTLHKGDTEDNNNNITNNNINNKAEHTKHVVARCPTLALSESGTIMWLATPTGRYVNMWG